MRVSSEGGGGGVCTVCVLPSLCSFGAIYVCRAHDFFIYLFFFQATSP